MKYKIMFTNGERESTVEIEANSCIEACGVTYRTYKDCTDILSLTKIE